MNDKLFKKIKNAVASTTGSKITDKDIALVLYLAVAEVNARRVLEGAK
tara:strand:- start:308 stop:451 length:144 start_codon:yes stop_codon:yes gene_type:complete